MDLPFLGNKDLLKLPKTAFLSSREISPTVVLKCYDWATQERDKGTCVISGFHSPLERDVLSLLLISPVSQTIKRQSRQSCFTRNSYIIEIADKVVFGSLDEKGILYRLYLDAKAKGKRIEIMS